MKSTSKDRMVVSLITIVFLVTLYGIGYTLFGNPKPTGMITSSIKIVKRDNLQQIERYKKYSTVYAIKVQENNKFYLEYHGYGNSIPYESKFDLTTNQYNELVEDNDYWFEIKFSKPGSKTYGIIKRFYNEDPMLIK